MVPSVLAARYSHIGTAAHVCVVAVLKRRQLPSWALRGRDAAEGRGWRGAAVL